MFNRRRFLLLLPAYAASAQQLASPFNRKRPAPPNPIRIYIGCDTLSGVSKGIYSASFDPASGKLGTPTLAAETQRPSFLALSSPRNGHRSLYAVNAIKDPSASITTFDLDLKTGTLAQRSKVSSSGAGPCFLSVDSTGKAAFVANYWGATIATYSIQSDGTLSNPIETFNYREPRFGKDGPNTVRQEQPHPHSVFLSPDNRFLIVNDLGHDALSVYSIDAATAKLTPSSPLLTSVRAGSGPRHIAFHPNGRWIYVVNELDSTLDRFLWSTTHATPSASPRGLLINADTTVSTVAKDFPKEKNTAAEVMISPDGKYLYVSNRGEDTLVVFAINDDGSLKEVQRISCGGKTPRHFTFDPTFRWILCGNQESASVAVFRRDQGTGKLTGPTNSISVDSPMYILFA
jgi:6-phosphogluconolactonase